MDNPRLFWVPSISPSSIIFYTGEKFPKWRNSVFVGGLRGTAVYRLEMNGDQVTAEEPLLGNLRLRIRDVREGPDGELYVLSDGPGAKLMKLTPAAKRES